ncbi:CYTH domain-containing protein [Terribacillus saccharophilus]|uniref:CYTH domain-containing protein n=1 Tax=Terribacillus saccharophilus TaxID=361277 RepID=UPI002DCF2CF6|nr:CYTH domain-containing protein [Terribacillus saccharophilus]MEC0289422.1 CYTH domain-containing protein [Terribacillus saccharophilus]
MPQEIEIEFKNLLTKAEFNKLYIAFNMESVPEIQQVNHYFETKDFQLKQHGAALRIREKNGQYQSTLKQPQGDGLLETHDYLTEQEANSWLQGSITLGPEISKQLQELGISAAALTYGGSLETIRREKSYNDTIIVLDKSKYSDVTDYELELEAQSYAHGERVFSTILTENDIAKRKTPNKIQRFYDSLRNR